ncbi:MAG: hypothetical protein H6704_30675 [Myxococcales bacterium]|nr:hypothetical protein [Myxococcales bacterium]
MPWILGMVLAFAGVAVTSDPALKLDIADAKAAVEAFRARTVGAGPAKEHAALPREALRFTLRSVKVPQVTPFAPILQAYFARELERGWVVSGAMGPVREDGRRSGRFTRAHAGFDIRWSIAGTATPVACGPSLAGADVVGCYEVLPDGPDGSAWLAITPDTGVRLYPRLAVALTRAADGGLAARLEGMALVRRADAAGLKVPPGELGAAGVATLATILEALAQKAGGDAWRVQLSAVFAVTPATPKTP